MICANCGQQQDLNNFCGTCGAKFGLAITPPQSNRLDEDAKQLTNAEVTPKEPNSFTNIARLRLKQYAQYFMKYLKKPSLARTEGETEYSNGLFSISLLAIFTGLAFFTIVSYVSNYEPRFYQVLVGTLFFSLVSIGIVIVTLSFINNLFGPKHSLKSIICLYAGHLPPLLVIAAISLLLTLIKSFSLGSLTLILAFVFAVSLLPLYLINTLLTKESGRVDPFYGYVIYIATLSIFFIFLSVVLADSSIGSLLKEFQYFF